jgi:DNA-binding response OmpR family regulator
MRLLTRSKLLVLDDDPAILMVLQDGLSSSTIAIVACNQLDQAQRRIRAESFDALLIDALPGYADVIKTFRYHNPTGPVLLITGQLGIDSQQSGADLVLYKPVGLVALRQKIDELLAATAAPSVPVAANCDSESKELFELEQTVLTAWRLSDVGLLDSVLSENYVFSGSFGTGYATTDRRSLLKSGQLRIDSLTIERGEVKHYGDIGIVTTMLNIFGKESETSISGRYRCVRIYNRKTLGWRAVAGQLSPVDSSQA